MSLEKAFAFLGVAPGCTAREARSAYLRLLRQHKPDRDPDGFQRLREAYETVKAFLEAEPRPAGIAPVLRFDRRFREARPVPVPLSEMPDAGDDDAGEEEAVDDDAGDDHDARGHDDLEADDTSAWEGFPPLPTDPLEPFIARLRALDAEDDDDVEERLTIAREAVRELPDNPRAYRLLAFLAAEADRHEEARIALRAGVARGIDDCFQLLLEHYAPNLGADELASAGESNHPERLLMAASEHIRRGQAATAARVTLRAFEVAEETGARLSVMAAVRVVLQLQTGGWLEPSEEVAEQLDSWLEVHGSFRELDAEAAVLWQLAGELRQLPREFPQRLRSAIARGMLDGRMSDVSDAVHEYAMAEPRAAVRAAELLRRAPTLSNFYHHLLSGPLSEDFEGGQSVGGFRALWYILMIFIGIGSLRSCERSYVPKPRPFPKASLANIWTANSDAPALAELCGSGDPPAPDLCLNAIAMLAHLDGSRCSAAMETLAVLETGMASELARLASLPPPESATRTAPSATAGGVSLQGDVPVEFQDPQALVPLAVAELTGLWKQFCQRSVQLHERDREAYPETTAYCRDQQTIIALDVCRQARHTVDLIGIGNCGGGRTAFDALNRLLDTDDPEAPLHRVVTEIYGGLQAACDGR